MKFILGWGRSLVILAIGAAFLGLAATQNAAATEYRNAPRCGSTMSGHCREMLPARSGPSRSASQKASVLILFVVVPLMFLMGTSSR